MRRPGKVLAHVFALPRGSCVPAHSPGVGKNQAGEGAARPGDRRRRGVEEKKNSLNVLTAGLFFFTYFAQGSDFLLGGEGSPWVQARSAGPVYSGSQSPGFSLCLSPSLLLRRCRGFLVKENTGQLNF